MTPDAQVEQAERDAAQITTSLDNEGGVHAKTTLEGPR